MLNILFTVLLFCLVLILFKLFPRYKVVSLHAIVINYFTAAALGFWFTESNITFQEILNSYWLLHAIVVGLLFVTLFNLIAFGTQTIGLATTTVVNKMSLILPVIFSFLFYDDVITVIKIMGIVIALIGIYFSTVKNGKLSFDARYLWIAIIIFLVQGAVDIIFNYAQRTTVEPEELQIFCGTLFLSAAVGGTVFAMPIYLRTKQPLRLNSVVFGLLVGIPNFGSLICIFNALEELPPSIVFPFVSMGIVITSALSAILFFKEKLTVLNWVGISLASIAILLLAYA